MPAKVQTRCHLSVSTLLVVTTTAHIPSLTNNLSTLYLIGTTHNSKPLKQSPTAGIHPKAYTSPSSHARATYTHPLF